ncbi:MAG: hypothetical protein LBG07_06180 [Treponema sp.]|jgi:hypothetical protein|nr:hypothetical protein [Treponema sp.]
MQDMCVHRLKRDILGASFIILLSAACNQADTVLSSAGTYQVNALNGGFSLNEYSVIAAGDTIRPYFVDPVLDDPDLRGLVLYVEDSDGTLLGNRIFYRQDTDSASSAQSEEDRFSDPDQVLEEESAGGVETAKTTQSAETTQTAETTQATETTQTAKTTQAAKTTQIGAIFPDDDITIPVKNFTKTLPPFPLPEGLEIGAYSLIFEIRGERTVLNRVNQPFYYIADREFAAGEIRHYLPGFYKNSHLVAPGLMVMLETLVDYGKDLDPYVIWYNGKKKIGEGFAAAGAVRLLWKAPLRPGFHTIRAELFPSRPRAGQKGKIKEFSLPVSQKNETDFAAAADDYLYWYRFAGDLLDARTGKALNLVQGEKVSPSWYPAEQVYGLALDEGEVYELPACFLEIPENGGGRLGFFIRLLPLKDDRVFSARLGSSLTVSLFLEEGALFLDLEEQGQLSRISRVLPESGRRPSFTGVFITVRFDEFRAAASLALGALDGAGASWPGMDVEDESAPEEPLALSEWAEISLNEPLSGELHSWVGAVREPTKPEKGTELQEEKPASGSPKETTGPALPVLVLDDLAALFRGGQDPVEDTTPAGDSPETLDEDGRAGGSTVPFLDTAG